MLGSPSAVRAATLCLILALSASAAGAQEPGQRPPTTGAEAAAQETPATPPATTAQEPQTPTTEAPLGGSILQYVEELPESEAVTFRFHNRDITTLRARVLGRDPAARAATATRRLNEAIARGGSHLLELAAVETARMITMDSEGIVAIVPQDLDVLSSETVAEKADEALARLQLAVAEAIEMRTPELLLRAAARTAAATLLFVVLVLLLMRLRHRLEKPLVAAASERISEESATGRWLRSQIRLERITRQVLVALLAAFSLMVSYVWLTYSLRQFPYTRPWGEALGETLLATFAWVARGIAEAVPGLFTIAIVFLVTRLLTRLVRAFFDAVRDRRIHIVGLDPEAARPTRQIAVAILWIFALVVAYPYLPGSDTDAFRGVSVFVGLVLSIGSTGIVNQAMSGLILMYSSALKAGEYVKVGDIEGTVMRLGMLSTRIRTLHRELVTVPNSVMIAAETTNYSRLSNNGVAIKTSITLGYDIPWRQVHAVLRLAAERTSQIRAEPEPIILQTALSDFYVAYQLVAYIDEPRARPRQLSELHGHILDLCNEHGIQILSPHYEQDPDEPAVVPRDRWAPPPAAADVEPPVGGAARPPVEPAAE
jgi:small-conductance mechanosensitive channel